jgi:chloramphenicol 3-O-phosphotransferase
MRERPPTEVIVLNGGSGSGKSSIEQILQAARDRPWITPSRLRKMSRGRSRWASIRWC